MFLFLFYKIQRALYPFKVDQIGIHIEIMRIIILFKFITPIYQKDLFLLQNSSILKRIDLLHEKKKHIHFLQNEIVYKKIEEKLQQPSIQMKIRELHELFKNEVCSDLRNVFWQRKKHIISLPYEKDFSEKIFQLRSTN